MDILSFVITVIVLTASGALAPGPLFFATITHGSKHGAKSGLIFSIAHTVVEFTLIMLFALGLITIASEPIVRQVIGLIGGSVLILFGVIQIRNTIRFKPEDLKKPKASYRRLFIIGIVFTALNPYFILWWLTVGAQLIIISLEFAALLGVIFMFMCHVWMDYVWLTGVAYFSKKGTDVMGLKWYRPLMVIFGGILIYFGITFIIPIIA
jgi:threonine/homoserine/homoserine lactone efflux protein